MVLGLGVSLRVALGMTKHLHFPVNSSFNNKLLFLVCLTINDYFSYGSLEPNIIKDRFKTPGWDLQLDPLLQRTTLFQHLLHWNELL